MRWWGKRKRATHTKRTTLSIEPLEDRAMMAAIPLVSGQAVTFYDGDGTQVKVKLVGPGSGTIELEGGLHSGADIDSIVLNDTTGASKLKISTRGGTIKGTTVNDLVINKALNEVGALKKLTGRKVDFLDGGEFTADGGIEHIHVRTLGGDVNVDGDVNMLKADTVDPNATVDVSGSIATFVAKLLDVGSTVGAGQIEMLKVKDQANGARVETGAGGLVQAKIKNIYNSSLASEGMIGTVEVTGNAMGAALASNINMGSDEEYGTIDDFVVDTSATGYINMVKLKGAVGASGAEEVRIVSSGRVGNVEVSKSAAEPMIWQQAASSNTPLSIVQAMNGSTPLTGFDDDEIYVAIFGEVIKKGAKTGKSYYLAPSGTPGQLPPLTKVPQHPQPGPNTPNLITLPSYTLSQWVDATQTWGSQLNFPSPPPTEEWTGRIVISAGAPVQAQIAMNGTVTAPSPSNPTDPSTGTFYDFIEFTLTSDKHGVPTLDADTSQVDSFGMPMLLEFFQPLTTSFTGTIDTTTNSITGIADTTGLYAGQALGGTNIPGGATIASVVPSTTTIPGSIAVNGTLTTPGAGSFTATSSNWQEYHFNFNGVASTTSNVITGIQHLHTLVKQQYLAFGQPITATGILYPGTVITDYDIDAGTITLNQAPMANTSGPSTTFTYEVAGPVGVAADRDVIMSQTNPTGITNYLQVLVNGGNDQARPFLQATAPFLANGAVPLSGASANGAPIVINTSGTSNLQPGDQIEIDGVLGNTAANGVFQVASATSNSITLGSPIGNGTYNTQSQAFWTFAGAPVTGATASQATITANAGDITTANLQDGDEVTIASVGGNTAVNGSFLVGSVGATTFELTGPVSDGSDPSGTWTLAGTTNQVSFTCTSAAGGLITLTTNSAGLVAGDVVQINGTGNAALDGNYFAIASPTGVGFTLGSPAGTSAYTSNTGTWQVGGGTLYNIQGATRGGQVVITTNSTTGLTSGESITVSNVEGNTAANGTYNISQITSSTFTLDGTLSNGFYIPATGTWTESNQTPVSITGASSGPIVISTTNTGALANGDQVTIAGVLGNTAANGTFVVSNVVANTSFQLANPIGNAVYQKFGTWSLSVTNATNALIQTGSTTGLSNGDTVTITGVGGNTAVNGQFVVGSVTPTSFGLMNPVGIGDYTTGGTWSLASGGSSTNLTSVTNNGVPIVVTAQSTSGLAVGDIISIQNVGGNIMANGWFVVESISNLDITLGAPVSATPYTTSSGTWTGNNGGGGTVTYASKGDDITIVTANTVGLETGSMVEVMGVQGNRSANNVFYVGEVTDTTFTLQGSNSLAGYTLGGTWNQYESLNRLVSPKDLAESITDPANLSAINNYFNVLIDDFFLQYLPTGQSVSGWQGIGDTFSLVSTAYGKGALTYSGTVQQVTIDALVGGAQQYSGYALQLSDPTQTDPNTYNIIYPFFNTNAPAPQVYTPIFGSFTAPVWIQSANQQFESASQMIFACDAIFADNNERSGIDLPTTDNSVEVLGDLENSIAAAFNRGIIMNDPSTWSDNSTWYQSDSEFNTYNYWAQYWHESGVTDGDLAYAFPYDDKFGLSTNLSMTSLGLAQVTLGSWSNTKTPLQTFTITSPTGQPIAQQGAASFTATLTGSGATPTGSVAFFLNGIPVNSNNDSATPPLQLNLLSSGAATINANLPATSDADSTHTYTLTAVYTGDSNYLPSVATFSVQLSG